MQGKTNIGRFAISVREISKRTVIVHAEDLEAAIEKVEAAVECDKILLDADDFDEREITASEYWKDGRIPDGEDVSYYFHLDSNSIQVNLRLLYETGHKYLDNGGKILHEYDSYYLYQDGVNGEPLLSNGEYVEVQQKLADIILVGSLKTNCKVWFTPEEFEIVTMSSPT